MGFKWLYLTSCAGLSAPLFPDKTLYSDENVEALLDFVFAYYQTAEHDQYGDHALLPAPAGLKEKYLEQVRGAKGEIAIKMTNCKLNTGCCDLTLLRVNENRIGKKYLTMTNDELDQLVC